MYFSIVKHKIWVFALLFIVKNKVFDLRINIKMNKKWPLFGRPIHIRIYWKLILPIQLEFEFWKVILNTIDLGFALHFEEITYEYLNQFMASTDVSVVNSAQHMEPCAGKVHLNDRLI